LNSQSVLSERYTTYEEIEARMNVWHNDFSDNIDPYPNYPGNEGIIYHHEIIGYSGVDELPIWAIKLTMNADIEEDKPKVLILGQCHAEEIFGVEVAMDLVDWLLYPIDHPAQYLSIYDVMSKVEIWVVPTYNPEGLSVVHGWYDTMDHWNQDVYYRKNKYDANGNGIFDFVIGIGNDPDGVDLNRNYDFNWFFGDGLNQTDSGCGANPSYIANYDYYKGPYPFSENEVTTIRDFALDNDFLLSIAYHSSRSGCVAEKVIYPWEWTPEKTSPDFAISSRLGQEISLFLPKEAESGFYAPSSSISRRGNAHDWFYSQTGCIQYLIEVGTENMQPDDINIIEQTIENNVLGALHLIKRAGGSNVQGGPDKHQITGIVSSSDGSLLDNVEVWIDELNGPMLEPRLTDSYGRYRRLLVEGTYTINFRKHGYESQSYTFVPSSSQVTEYNVSLNPLSTYSVNFNVNLPSSFDEELNMVIHSETIQDTIAYVNQILLPEGLYNIKIYSENLFPEILDVSIGQDVDINLDLKWKSTIFYDNFSNLDNWDYEGSWTIQNNQLYSQSNLVYSNSLSNELDLLLPLTSEYNYVLDMDLKYELEWEYDTFNINGEGVALTGHKYELHNRFFDISGYSDISFSLNTDESLNYRGVVIDNISILQKPDIFDCDKSGDLNQDVITNIVDVIQLVNTIFSENVGSFEFCLSDMNDDEILDVVDIIGIINEIFNN